MELNTIHTMDCITGMRQLVGDESVDVVVTSPPYNIGIDYNVYRDNKSEGEYLEWIAAAAGEVRRVLKPDGSFFLNVGGKPSEPLWPLKIALRCAAVFTLQNTIHWIKSIAISKSEMGGYPHVLQDLTAGHFKPVQSAALLNGCHEYIFHFTKEGGVPLDKLAVGVEYQDKTNQARWQSAGPLRDRGNTWFIPYETIHESRPHPSTFPVKLPEMCLKLHGLSRAKVCLDPFMGIGSTALACVRLGVSYLGFEIDESYAAIAGERVATEIRLREKAEAAPRGDAPRQAAAAGRSEASFKIVIEDLPPAEAAPLVREVRGSGRPAALLRRLQRQYSPRDGILILLEGDLEKIRRCLAEGAREGFRERLAPVLERLRRIRRDLDLPEQDSLFRRG
jgi:site-specific DNA-methyltransferase (adenine-specific)